MEKSIILFTDGSDSSTKAMGLAVELAFLYKTDLFAFFIIDSGWNNLLGDEWINTSETRMRFYRWFEGGLKAFAAESLQKVTEMAQARGVQATTQMLTGSAEKIMIHCAGERPGAYLVLPNPEVTAPGASGGLKYNIRTLIKKISCPVIIGPK